VTKDSTTTGPAGRLVADLSGWWFADLSVWWW
jgi:hypothetical protein